MTESAETRNHEARRRAILTAAVEAFAEKGGFASRTRAIAARTGVAEGTIYLYFGGKDNLLLTAFREKVSDFCDTAQSLLTSTLPFPERLIPLAHRLAPTLYRGLQA